VIRENLHSLGLESRAQVRHGRARAVLPGVEADIVFLDPPYRLEAEYAATLALLGEKVPAPKLTIVQHDVRTVLAEKYGLLRRSRALKQGDNVLSFYRGAQ